MTLPEYGSEFLHKRVTLPDGESIYRAFDEGELFKNPGAHPLYERFAQALGGQELNGWMLTHVFIQSLNRASDIGYPKKTLRDVLAYFYEFVHAVAPDPEVESDARSVILRLQEVTIKEILDQKEDEKNYYSPPKPPFFSQG